MKKVLRFIGTVSALILSLFGVTACFKGEAALYGPPEMFDSEYEQINETQSSNTNSQNQ